MMLKDDSQKHLAAICNGNRSLITLCEIPRFSSPKMATGSSSRVSLVTFDMMLHWGHRGDAGALEGLAPRLLPC